MTKRAGVFALVCAVVGLTASVAASYTHYHLLFDPAYRSFCDVNERISCTTVYMSRYSTFQGIPVAIFVRIAGDHVTAHAANDNGWAAMAGGILATLCALGALLMLGRAVVPGRWRRAFWLFPPLWLDRELYS